jgi:nifR3 family TIM-barrel protein
MEDVTDIGFRMLCKRFGASMVYTEFVSAEALVRDIKSTVRKLTISDEERPVGIQIYGRDVDAMVEAAKIVEQAGPDVIDLNFGCPVKKVAGKGAGSGMLRDVPKLLAITKAVVEAVNIPVTVKTRLGWDENSKIIVDLAEAIQDCGAEALAIHGRTRAQMYTGEADWTLIGEVKNNPRMIIPVFGNGDIDSAQKMLEYKNRYGVDGILIGRAAMGNPFIFAQCKDILNGKNNSVFHIKERVAVCKRHLEGLKEWRGDRYAILEMRKFYSGYFKGLNNFKPYRIRLVTTNSYEEIEEILSLVEKDFDYEF